MIILLHDNVESILINLNIWIQRSEIGATFHGIKYKAAIWGAGNCLIVLRSVTANTSELFYVNFRHTLPDKYFCETWNKIAKILSEAYEITIPRLDPFFTRISMEELFIEAIERPETNPLLSEAEWKERERETFRPTAEQLVYDVSSISEKEVTAADILESHVEQAWTEFCERLERAKAIIRARKETVGLTSAEGAERFWSKLQSVAGSNESNDHSRKTAGHPGLSAEELEYRLQKAQEAESIREREPHKTWKEIAKQINWRFGTNKGGVKLLEDARMRLKRQREKET